MGVNHINERRNFLATITNLPAKEWVNFNYIVMRSKVPRNRVAAYLKQAKAEGFMQKKLDCSHGINCTYWQRIADVPDLNDPFQARTWT